MKEAIWSFCLDVVVWSFILYLVIMLIDLFKKVIYNKVQEEPNYLFIAWVVIFVEIVQRIYSLI